MTSSLRLWCPVRSHRSCVVVGLMICLAAVYVAPAALAQPQPADTIYPGDTVVVVKESVELGLKDKVAVLLDSGARIRVTEVRGVWIGGHATIDGQRYTGWVNRREVQLADTDPGSVTVIEDPGQPDDADAIAALKALRVKLDLNDAGNVISADASESQVDEAGLKHFQGLRHLASLDLSDRPVTDESFLALGELKVLQELYLNGTQVSDAILKRVGSLKNLEILALGDTRVNGSSLGELKKLPALRVLNMSGCDVGNDQLEPLSEMTQIEVLVISRTKVTSAGLANLTPITKLRVLNLIGCDIDDTGLPHLEPLDNLRMLYVEETNVTEEGADELTASCPSLAVFQ